MKFDYQNLIDFIWERVGRDNGRTDDIMVKIDEWHEDKMDDEDLFVLIDEICHSDNYDTKEVYNQLSIAIKKHMKE